MTIKPPPLAVVVASMLAIGTVVAFAGPASAGTTLHAAAAEQGRYFGVAVMGSKLSDATYVSILNREFGMVTPENELQWDATEPARGSFNFGPADRIVAHANGQGQRIRGRALVSPDASHTGWLASIGSATDLAAVMRNHISGVMGHFRGGVYAWDVVNEAFADSGGGLRASLWTRLGQNTGWIEDAFRTARAADPAAKLCYNDYGIESWTAAKTQAVYAMVADFKARGVPIDCVGLESHFSTSVPVPADYRTTLERFVALGVDVQITELDIEGSGATQAANYRTVVRACLTVPGCTGLTVWGVRDSDSWRSGGTPVLFDTTGAAKPAYAAVLQALNEPVGPTTAPTSAAPSSAAPSSALPSSRPPTSAPVAGCTAVVSASSWGSGFVATVKVTAGPRAISRWTVTVVLPRGTAVSTVWGASASGRTGTVRFTDAGYNGRIAAGKSTTFGFSGSGGHTGITVSSCTAS